MSRYIPPEEMSEAQIREQLDAEYKHWDDLKKNGCSDPAWPDGVNLNLVRNHIIYWYRLLRERTSQTVQIDAACADEIVQHALFGDLVFG